MSDPRAIARRRLGAATALLLIAFTVATHWPALELGTPEDPGPDKVIHVFALALITAGAWYAGWFRTLPRLWIAGLAWSALDEWSQGFRWLERVPDLEDWISDALGVTVAIAWIHATAPLGGWQSQRRRHARDRAMAEVFGHWWAWLVPIGAALAVAALSWPLFRLIASRSWAMPPRQVIVTGMLIMGLAAAIGSVEVLLRRLRPSPWPALPDRAHLKLIAGPALSALAALVLLVALAQMALILREHVTAMAVIEEWYRRRPQTFRAAIDLAIILLLAAWACRRARRFIARRVDRAHEECLRCGHSLHGLVPAEGPGRCPECGALYERPPEELAGAAVPPIPPPAPPTVAP